MKKWLLTLSLLTFASFAFAQKIKVKRVKGNQAVVEFSGGTLENGQVYELAGDDFVGTDSSTPSSRNNLLGLRFSFINTKSDAANSQNETDMRLDAQYGWNFGTFEIGPVVTYNSDQSGNVTTTSLVFGGFADYNLIPNMPGEVFVYGLGAQGGFGQSDSGTGQKRDVMLILAGPFAKWFPTGQNFGLRLDLSYMYLKSSGGTTDTTLTGLAFGAEVVTYF
ncbi:MAG: hypothetical protein HUU57_01225 [Bdellovibrio sp.]|nr:hypothetical protein [Bdellovibrio sp.]